MPGGTGRAGVRTGTDRATRAVPITVVEVEPPRRFSFRWVYGEDETAAPGNSLLVTFDLVPAGAGTTVRMSETGFREMGWEAAVLEEQYRDHVARLGPLPAASGRVRRAGWWPRDEPLAVDDDLWSAIGDPTRRRMLDLLLADGPAARRPRLSEQLPGDPAGRGQAPRPCSTGSGSCTRTPAGRERRYGVDEAQLARAVAQLSPRRRRRGTPACAASSGSPRRSSAARTAEPAPQPAPSSRRSPALAPGRITPRGRQHPRGRGETMVDILHRVGVEGRRPTTSTRR